MTERPRLPDGFYVTDLGDGNIRVQFNGEPNLNTWAHDYRSDEIISHLLRAFLPTDTPDAGEKYPPESDEIAQRLGYHNTQHAIDIGKQQPAQSAGELGLVGEFERMLGTSMDTWIHGANVHDQTDQRFRSIMAWLVEAVDAKLMVNP